MKYENIVELRASGESRLIEGKAIVFESLSNDLGFYETIKRGAITLDVIDNSNIIFTFNHDSSKVLARSRNGKGNMNIELREDGVYFSFEAPHTTLGDDTLENIRCGVLDKCSFAFTIPNEEGAQRWHRKDGVMYRDVYKIDQLFDFSIVTNEGYSSTYISARSAEAADAEKEILEAEKRAAEEAEKVEEPVETVPEPQESSQDELPNEADINNTEEEEVVPETNSEELRNIEEDLINTTENINKENLHKIHMNKNFSLVRAIRSAMNNQAFDDATQLLMAEAQKEMRSSGINYEGQIQLPLETRAQEAITVTDQGEEPSVVDGTHPHVIELNFQSMLKPMRENSVLFNCGAKVLSGLVGDVKVPELKAGNAFAGWAGEIEEADEYFASFDSFTISPKRLTVVTAISKLMLAQDSIGVENAIRQDILEAFANKLESTVFGAGAGDADTPAGILNGKTAVEVEDYADLCNLEATPADSYNNFGNFKYILSPKAKAALRCMIKGNNNTGMVLAGDSVDGTPSQMTTFLNNKDFLYLDPSAIWICQWGGLDITVDNITLASRGMVKLVLNMYVNVKYVRSQESIIYGTIK